MDIGNENNMLFYNDEESHIGRIDGIYGDVDLNVMVVD